jgi:hypothetical protein
MAPSHLLTREIHRQHPLNLPTSISLPAHDRHNHHLLQHSLPSNFNTASETPIPVDPQIEVPEDPTG